ncbi:lipase [Bordetella ansorpii]|uniref:Lipase n=1 Tax=Bordetella ansorpii TaxID=288768 RepID=A0A157LS20_9BORD|nr:alpha/beta hydrolase [Bordetella ansorpii]SAH99254.1 lipase [Bordetella ansorpii]
MPLHPDIDAFLELVNHSGNPPLSELGIERARAAYDAATEAMDLPGPDVPTQDLSLTASDGATLRARLYRGASGTLPALLFLHGGGYVLGGLESHDSLCRSLAQESGWAVLALDYRKAPEHRFPTAFRDARDALAWLRAQAHCLDLDPARLAVGGDSVGGSLAAALCLDERAHGRPQPLLQLLLYPCTASHQDSASHLRLARGHLLEKHTLDWMFDQYLRDPADRRDWRFAPLAASDLAGLAPAYLAVGDHDPLVDEAQAYADRLRQAGVPVQWDLCAGMVHDFARLGMITDEAAALRSRLAHALRTLTPP